VNPGPPTGVRPSGGYHGELRIPGCRTLSEWSGKGGLVTLIPCDLDQAADYKPKPKGLLDMKGCAHWYLVSEHCPRPSRIDDGDYMDLMSDEVIYDSPQFRS